MRAWIAEEDVVFVLEDGPRTPGKIAVGLPVKRESDCACEVMIGPMDIHTICRFVWFTAGKSFVNR